MTIYLDHAAATPLRPEVLDRMLPFLTGTFGNPSSPHSAGRHARLALDEAHEMVASALHADPREVVFTSGGTESINLALKGGAWAGKAMGHRIVTTAVEHRAVLDACASLEKFGFEVVLVGVDRYGRVDPDALDDALTERTCLVSLQLANNEVGTVADLAPLIARVRAVAKALVHVDAVQAAPTMAIDVRALGADLLSVAGHKLEGPRGVGVLWLRRGTAILPQMHGGSQERHRRAGTEDVAAAVGMAEAWRLCVAERESVVPDLTARRDRLWASLQDLGDVELTGHPRDRLPGLLSVLVGGLDGAALVHALDLAGLCCSTGSACTTGSTEPSHVLTAMGYPGEEARGALRLSLGRTTTDADVDKAAAILGEVIRHQRDGISRLAAPATIPMVAAVPVEPIVLEDIA
jgi:cysteine desulfurase